MNAARTKKLPAAYFHRPGKSKRQDCFQRQDGPTVRKRSKAAYEANQKLAKFTSVLWREKNPGRHREHVRKSSAKASESDLDEDR
jgi:hypothetical protein